MSITYRTRQALPAAIPADVLAVLEMFRQAWLALNREPAGIERLAYGTNGTPYWHATQAFVRTLAALPGVTIEDAERVIEEIHDNGEDTTWNYALLAHGEITPDGLPFIEDEIDRLAEALSIGIEDRAHEDYIKGLRRELTDARLERDHLVRALP